MWLKSTRGNSTLSRTHRYGNITAWEETHGMAEQNAAAHSYGGDVHEWSSVRLQDYLFECVDQPAGGIAIRHYVKPGLRKTRK
jgi:hypothetical protein